MVSRVSVSPEVNHPNVVATVREEEAEAGVSVPHHDIGGCGLVTRQIEDNWGLGGTRGDPEQSRTYFSGILT